MLKNEKGEEGKFLRKTSISALLVTLLAILLSVTVLPAAAQGGPNGPRTDNMLIHVYLNPDVENIELEAGTLNINDWPLSKEWIDKWAENPDIVMRSYAEIGMMEFDLNNQVWPTGNTMPRALDPSTGTYKHYIGTNPWDDEATEFRKALSHLADKDRYVSEILKGYGYRMDSCMPTPALGGYVPPDLVIYEYDPVKAGQILDAAGFVYGTGQWRVDPKTGNDLAPLEMYVRIDDPNRRAAGELFRDELRANGIPVNAHITEKSVCYKKCMVEYDYHIYTGGWSLTADIDFLYWLWSSEMYFGGTATSHLYGVGWSLNYPGYCSPGFDAEAMKLLVATDAAEIRPAAFDAQRYMAGDAAIISLWCSAAVKAYEAGFDGVVAQEGFGIDNYWTFLNMYKAGDDTIDYGFKSNVEAIHVVASEWLWDWNVIGLIYDAPIGLNPYNFADDYGWLVESWETGDYPGGKMYIEFTFRDDVKFHDGTSMTPYDYAFSCIFPRDCGPGIAWLITACTDIEEVQIHPTQNLNNHPDIVSNAALGTYDAKVIFAYPSYWALHWAGNMPVLNSGLWLSADTKYGWKFGDVVNWDPVDGSGPNAKGVRDYHLWNEDVNDNEIIDLVEDGTGAWKYKDTEKPEAISASTWISLEAHRNFVKTQTEISDYLAMSFHSIGDIDFSREINILDLSKIARALGTDDTYPWGTGWDEYNPDTDVFTCISWPEWILGDGYVDIDDLTIAAKGYGRIAG